MAGRHSCWRKGMRRLGFMRELVLNASDTARLTGNRARTQETGSGDKGR